MYYFDRALETIIAHSLQTFSSILVTGARRCGKSTLLTHQLPDSPQLNLDRPTIRARVYEDHSWLAPNGKTLLLREIQKQPDLLEILKAHIDESPSKRGLYALTGSEQFRLMKGVRESLAGRIAIHTLWPFSWSELERAGVLGPNRQSLLELIIRGGYPSLWEDACIASSVWMQSYVDTYLERDVELHFGVSRLPEFIRLIELLAARTGQLMNVSELGRDCRVADTTVREWISILELSYIIRTVPPWHENPSKRSVKMPKVYFVDTGLLCYFLGIDSASSFERHPSRGAVFENFIFSEILKTLSLDAKRSNLFFYRTYDGQEVDFIVERAWRRVGIEAKYTDSSKPNHGRHLKGLLDAGLLQEALLVSTSDDLSDLSAGGWYHVAWHQLHQRLRPPSSHSLSRP